MCLIRVLRVFEMLDEPSGLMICSVVRARAASVLWRAFFVHVARSCCRRCHTHRARFVAVRHELAVCCLAAACVVCACLLS